MLCSLGWLYTIFARLSLVILKIVKVNLKGENQQLMWIKPCIPSGYIYNFYKLYKLETL